VTRVDNRTYVAHVDIFGMDLHDVVLKCDPIPHGFALVFCETNAIPHSKISVENDSSRKRTSVWV